VFDLVASLGRIERAELERTLNMGVGMVAVVSSGIADRAVDLLTGRGVPAWIAGELVEGDGSVELHGTHRR
jgi:phosphoribosylformylglycinamidine cyclo-ligase